MRGKPRVTCTARAKSTGERCGRAPIPGGTVCKFHGGGTAAARAAGRRRLEESFTRRQLAAWEAAENARRAALSPWQNEPAIAFPQVFAEPGDLRRIAREMNAVARVLRETAKALESPEFSDSS